MLKQCLLKMICLVGLLLVSAALFACTSTTNSGAETPDIPTATEDRGDGGQEAESIIEEADTQEIVAETEDEGDTEETVVTQEPETASNDTENLLDPNVSRSNEVECVPVEIPENPLIAAVSNEDWSKGQADAPITVIEYGDFQ